MNTLDLLSALSPFRDWSPAEILASPAWAMPCRLGTEEGRLVSEGALLPADPLRLSIRFADTPATLALADSTLFPELHALWPSRSDVPAPILLALVEKECGPVLQLLENAAGRQLAIDGLAEAGPEQAGASSAELRPFILLRSSGESLCTFALTLSPALVEIFGTLRNLDASHSSIRDLALSAVVQIAAPVLSTADLDSLAPGDHLLLPEAASPDGATFLVADRLAASAEGVVPWSDPGTLRIVLSDPVTITFGKLADAVSGGAGDLPRPLREGAPLALVRGPATLANGRLSSVAKQPSFAIETVTPQS